MATLTRHTKQRQAVLGTVKLSLQPVSADDVRARMKKLFPGLGYATVYRNLNVLAKRGEVFRVDGEDGVKRFIGHALHQASFTCQRCGQSEQWTLLPTEVVTTQKIFGRRDVFFKRLTAQGLCESCLKILRRQGVRT